METKAELLASISETARNALRQKTSGDDRVLGIVRIDLDEQLRFAQRLVVVTARRVLCLTCVPPGIAAAATTSDDWQVWELDGTRSLRARDRGGVGSLELVGPDGIVVAWHFTIGRMTTVQSAVRALENARAGRDEVVEDEAEAETPIRTEAPEPAAAKSLFRLLRFARQRLGLVLLGGVLSIATTVVGLVPPYLTQPLVDDVLIPYSHDLDAVQHAPEAERPQAEAEFARKKQDRVDDVIWYLGAFGVASLLAWILAWGQGIVLAWVSERISADMRVATYAHLQRLSIEYFGGKRTGDLMSRISTDTDRVCTFLSDNLVDFIADVLMIVGSAAVLFTIDPLLAAATLCPVPVIAWLIYRIRNALKHGFGRGGRAWGQMTNVLADTIPGIRVVKAFAQERREVERFREANNRILDANDRVNLVWTFFWPMVALLNQIGLLVVWAAGARQVFAGRVSVGVLTMFLAYIGRFYARLESMSRLVSAVQRAGAGARRVFEILDQSPSVPDPAEPMPIDHLRGEIELRDVTFRYGNRAILNGIQLRIRPGEMIGLVGPSGSGKSTLVNLVCRFYDVASGAILIDGTDVRAFAVQDYRRHIGLVLQEPFLFFGTVAENIAYGKPEATRDEIVAAAKAAHAHDFILRLPLGYDSLVGERGQSLSGGERQRISIARALLIDPQILLLDEATSAVDNETEREIQAALDRLVQGRTTIAIAHRLTTLRKADRLVVLDRGRIVETGQHDDLLAAGGVYARLHHAQAEAAVESE